MKIYIIETEYIRNNEILFSKVSQEGYTELSKAIEFIKSRTDYKHSINDFLHYGENYNYTIREITIIGDIKK